MDNDAFLSERFETRRWCWISWSKDQIASRMQCRRQMHKDFGAPPFRTINEHILAHDEVEDAGWRRVYEQALPLELAKGADVFANAVQAAALKILTLWVYRNEVLAKSIW
jgi:hypothetical protein